jgi:lysine biosynthesis protein LysW
MPSCPDCDAEIEVDALDEFDVTLGDRLTCGACGTHLEVVGVTPVQLAAESDTPDIDDGQDEQKDDEHADVLASTDMDEDDDWAG